MNKFSKVSLTTLIVLVIGLSVLLLHQNKMRQGYSEAMTKETLNEITDFSYHSKVILENLEKFKTVEREQEKLARSVYDSAIILDRRISQGYSGMINFNQLGGHFLLYKDMSDTMATGEYSNDLLDYYKEETKKMLAMHYTIWYVFFYDESSEIFINYYSNLVNLTHLREMKKHDKDVLNIRHYSSLPEELKDYFTTVYDSFEEYKVE
ncbi:hypothetical protein [Sutcliffiella deserti]|uniref:hypothetical protein n=1 Tax=Sutcliffiella deserti TaxID=2875501 RepID=UPI001CBC94E6|nr:hypothetical protein [Sutcliffiella deserti]